MIKWRKNGTMPISGAAFSGPIFNDPPYSTGGFRDPTTAWQGKDKVWRMATGCGDKKKVGETVAAYCPLLVSSQACFSMTIVSPPLPSVSATHDPPRARCPPPTYRQRLGLVNHVVWALAQTAE